MSYPHCKFDHRKLGCTTVQKTKTIDQRFDEKVEKTETCWFWKGGVTVKGYGTFFDGSRFWRAHIFAFVRAGGIRLPGYFICHSCDVPSCVNPEHLLAATPQQNTADMVRKGRHNFNFGSNRMARQ